MQQTVRYLLDTNVVSEWTKPNPDPRVVAWLESVDEDRVGLSVATLAEVRRGIERLAGGPKRRRLEEWLTHDLRERFEGRIFGVDADAADAWGRASARALAAGRASGEVDALIAGIADVNGLIVVTRDVDDFTPFGVETLNPWS
jgi:predicted nucleic acid-binding protein